MKTENQVVRTARLFEFHAKYLWNFHRHLVKRHLSPRCKNCSLSSKASPLNDKGICKLCINYDGPTKEQGNGPLLESQKEECEKIISDHVGKGPRYDALVLSSGGKDSAYLLYTLRKKFPKLRILSVLFDTGFHSPVALSNARHYSSELDLDLFVYQPASSITKKTFKYACTHLAPGKGSYEIVDRMDGHLGFDSSKHIAATNSIPLVMAGFSPYQTQTIFNHDGFEVPGSIMLKKTEQIAGLTLTDLYNEEELKYFWDPARYPNQTLPRFIFPFYVWRYDEQFIQEEVVRLGLISANNVSPLVTNPSIVVLTVVLDFIHSGYASFEHEFAKLAREGKSDKIFWRNVFEMLEYSSKTGRFIMKDLNDVLSQLDLSKADIGM